MAKNKYKQTDSIDQQIYTKVGNTTPSLFKLKVMLKVDTVPEDSPILTAGRLPPEDSL